MSRRTKRRSKIAGQFSWRLVEMQNSPAYRALSLSAHRVLDRLEIELGSHAGTENGKLPCTFDHFAEYGIHRQAIAPAIRETVLLGFVEITEHGRAGNAEYRTPNKFRLTYRNTDKDEPTNEWRRITKEEAELRIKEARALARQREKRKKSVQKIKFQWWKPTPNPELETNPETAKFPGLETNPTVLVRKPTLPLYLG
jgi:hypothetical protein